MATQPPKPQRRTRHSSRPLNGDGHPASIFVKKAKNPMARAELLESQLCDLAKVPDQC